MLIQVVASLSCLVVLSTGVAANPIFNRVSQSPNGIISLPISKNISLINRNTFLQNDRERLKNMVKTTAGIDQFDASNADAIDIPLDDMGALYATNFGVGDPETPYYLIVDTGSSNTWIGASRPYRKTKTSEMTGDFVAVTYGLGYFKGIEYRDTFTIAPDVAITRQSIGVADVSSEIRYDGILGIGPINLTLGSLYPHKNRIIPTVTDNLFKQGKIEQNLVSVSFEPTSDSPITNGELIFGGVDSAKYIGDINYLPITNTFPSSLYWGLDGSFLYGEEGDNNPYVLLQGGAGIVDTGTTLLYISTDAYNRYVKRTGAFLDPDTGFLRISQEKYDGLQSLFLNFGGSIYELIPNAQIWPRAQNGVIGGKQDYIYLVVHDMGQTSSGLDFIAGMVFLERYYSVFDTDNHRIGLASTQYTYAEIN